MDEIKELIYILAQNKIKFGAKDNPNGKDDSKMGLFYEGLVSGSIKDDADALKLLYPAKAGDAAYRKLKSQFRDKLFDCLLLFNGDQSHFTDYQQAYYECNKAMMFVKILAGQNAHRSALFLATKSLRQSTKYEFTLLSLDLLSYLMLQYGTRENNAQRLREVISEFELCRNIFDAECDAEYTYVNLISFLNNSKVDKEDIRKQSIRAFEKISPNLQQYDTYKLHLYGTIIGLMRYTTINDYRSALDFCLEKTDFFVKKPFHARAALQLLHYHELVCWIQFRNYESGASAAEKCFAITEEGTFNWFKYQELFLQLCFYSKEYEKAAAVVKSTMNHPRFRFLPDGSKEAWTLFEYYSKFILIATELTHDNNFSFRYRKMKNELENFSKDKGGMNAALIILRLLFLIVERKENILMEEVDSIEQYCYRHLNIPEMERSVCFIKILLNLPQSAFDIQAACKKNVKLLEQMQQVTVGQSFEVEIIPYEDLWNVLLDFYGKREKMIA